jgi:hypothetical protein
VTTGRGREKAGRVLACGLLARSADGYLGSTPEMPRTLTAALHREEDWYIAQCLEVDVASQGHTIDEALANPCRGRRAVPGRGGRSGRLY